MKALDYLTPQSLFIEIGQSSLKVLKEDEGLELPLERMENGRLTNSCRESVTLGLRKFLKKQQQWWLRPRAFCAIGARGVSMRRLTLPASSKEELQRLLLLQIESEFPLPPDELAWGCLRPGSDNRLGSAATQELIVVALKKEVVEEYSQILSGCGLNPVFTLGALARNAFCPQSGGAYAVLDIGRNHSELVTFENGAPASIRILPWGGEDITRSIEKKLETSRDEAEKIKIDLDRQSTSNAELGKKIQDGIQTELESLAGLINGKWNGRKLYLTGKSSRLREIAPRLASALGNGAECERLEMMSGEGRSAATLGLKRYLERNGGGPPLTLALKRTKGVESAAQPAPWQWAALACLLAIGSLSFRYVESVFLKPRLSRKLSVAKVYRDNLPKIDRELSFLRYLESNQPPYLDAMFVIANAAAPGTRLDSLTMNRRGEISLRGMMQVTQTPEFRSKLIDSGFFSTVVVDEQTPSPDRQRAVVRITAQWKTADVRPLLSTNTPVSKDSKGEKPPGEVNAGAPARRGALPPGAEIRR